MQAVDATAGKIAAMVDELLEKHWNRRAGAFEDPGFANPLPANGNNSGKVATCSCGSGIPVQEFYINGENINLVALPLIFENFRQDGKDLSSATAIELLETVKVYNQIPDGKDEEYRNAIFQEYASYCSNGGE